MLKKIIELNQLLNNDKLSFVAECDNEYANKTKDVAELIKKNIDKTHGSIYYEGFSNGGSRTICGFCWEKEHVKIPIVTELCYDEFQKQYYYSGYCNSCKAHCIENINHEMDDTNEGITEVVDDDLPF